MILLISCDDPSTVNADRNSNIFQNPDPNAPYLISDIDIVDFGFVDYDSIPKRRVKFTNVSGEDYVIQDIFLETNPSPYKLTNFEYPITLKADEYIVLNVDCRRNFSGEFDNKIIVSGKRADNIELRSNAYDLYVGTVRNEGLNLGDVGNRSFNILNYSQQIITIDSITVDYNLDDAFIFNEKIGERIQVLPGASNPVQLNYKVKAQNYRLFIAQLTIHCSQDISFDERIIISEFVSEN